MAGPEGRVGELEVSIPSQRLLKYKIAFIPAILLHSLDEHEVSIKFSENITTIEQAIAEQRHRLQYIS